MKTDTEGYYFSPERGEILQAAHGSYLPESQDWEYLGSASDMTPADAVTEAQERYPDVSVELEFRHL